MSERCTCRCGHTHTKRTVVLKTRRPSLADTTDLTPAHCHACGAPVLAGRIEALECSLDPDPLTEIGTAAYRPVRAMFTRTGTRARRISYAWRWPPPRGTTVHTEHRCGKPVPRELRELNITTHTRTTELPDNPPY